MRLILRPLMPPRSLIELIYAIRPFPVLLSGDAGPLNGNVAPTFTSALVTPGVSARAGAPRIVAPIAAASMDFLNIDIPLPGDGLHRSSRRRRPAPGAASLHSLQCITQPAAAASDTFPARP